MAVYDRFLLDNKEFTELIPTIDKDALINKLKAELELANQAKIDVRGGCNVGVTNRQTVRAGINKQKITFDTVTGPTYYNSIQSNGQPIYSLTGQEAIFYEEANSKRFYTLKATILYRYRSKGSNEISTNTLTTMGFVKEGISATSASFLTPVVSRPDNTSGSYINGGETNLYTINLEVKNQLLGGITDKIYISVLASIANFDLIVEPGSTFTVLPE
jgi:hypothetical protein